jgi:hypothetical protein
MQTEKNTSCLTWIFQALRAMSNIQEIKYDDRDIEQQETLVMSGSRQSKIERSLSQQTKHLPFSGASVFI